MEDRVSGRRIAAACDFHETQQHGKGTRKKINRKERKERKEESVPQLTYAPSVMVGAQPTSANDNKKLKDSITEVH